MATIQPLYQVHQETGDVVNPFRESSQAVVDGIMTIQDSTMQFGQDLFLSQQAESIYRSQQQWRSQTQKQQEAFQGLMAASMQIYTEFFLAPFSFSRQLAKTAQTAMRQEGEMENPFDCVIVGLGG